MRKFIVSQATTNRLLAYAAIVMIAVQSVLSYFVSLSLSETLAVFGLAVAMFALPLLIYFAKPSSAVFKYLFVFFAITYMFVILYIQKGNIDNLFLLYVGWELVGLSSYLLIGHWYEKKSASNAAMKAFNDTYGHPVGDLVLKETTRTVQEKIRKTDILCRFGGEEFTVIFKATCLEDAKVISEKIRSAVEKNALEHEGKPLSVTISIGVTEFRLHDGPASLVDRADKALLVAKQSGKNRVESA